MTEFTFFSCLKTAIKCSLCNEKDCPCKYLPDRKIVRAIHGEQILISKCRKDKNSLEYARTKRIKRELADMKKKSQMRTYKNTK